MRREDFQDILAANADVLSQIQDLAHKVHTAVNQHYDATHPYSVHLDSVADFVREYCPLVCDNPDDVVPILFGAYFHDSIEDARLTYNNVAHLASRFMDERQAHLATEIVYALTNEKGRNRAERANDKYYAGIRATPYAPLCKFADRLANVTYSVNHSDAAKSAMRYVYAKEHPHFVSAITALDTHDDPRLEVPSQMLQHLESLFNQD